MTGMASRSSRRSRAGNVSGHQASLPGRPPASRKRANAHGPRQCTRKSETSAPSSMARPSAAITIVRFRREDSRDAKCPPRPVESSASGIENRSGISLARTLRAPITPSASSAKVSQREGRHSRRQGADGVDKLREFGIGGRFVSHEPVPELIVLDFQQA